uniref:PSI-J n=1 Tax=Stigeoclonium sp. HB201635 TaxID=2493987 RepID=A0A6M3U8X6_9CHLO|nr:subunit IX of photosystem I [Stigeoclonium sp. HB201635]
MKDFTIYLSTAPVVAFAWLTFTAGFIIEIIFPRSISVLFLNNYNII